ncbi:hypothetical protein ACH5RR_032111 [Cinchona calisaya]|uniref:Ubiquitin-like protease family profile domain-containing protein n=1 Tax=Cinchona calisaya TaxID=153742 RepID=A0ABD2YH52_9GENT
MNWGEKFEVPSNHLKGPIGYETAEWHQQGVLDPHANGKLGSLHGMHVASSSKSIFENFPRGCRSKRGAVGKKASNVMESGVNKNEEHLSKNHVKTRRRAHRKRRRKILADSSDSEVIIPRFRLRGQRRGPVDSCNSTTQYGKLDSKTFERYMEGIWSRFSEEKRNSFTYLDSLWFSLYLQDCFKEKVLNWIKRKNIFSKKYVIVPIVIWSHWNLLILCNFGECPQSESRAPCMLLLDSLQMMNPTLLEPGIRKFVLDIHKVEQRSGNKQSIRKIPLLIPKVPQQRNGEECGYYVLYYISLFLENAPKNFSISKGYPYFMKEDWFTLERLDNFCEELNSASRVSSCSEELNSASRDSSSSEEYNVTGCSS